MTTLKEDLDARWRTKSKLTKAVVEVAAIIIVFVLTIGILALVTGIAHATCTHTADTCPTVHKFVKRFRAGDIKHDHGILVKKVWRRPVKARHLFVRKYEHYFNAHPKKQAALRKHGEWIRSHASARTAVASMSRTDGRSLLCNMAGPPPIDCLGYFEWHWLNAKSTCTGINMYPAAYDTSVCVRDDWNTHHAEEWPTWNEVKTGLKLTACTVATGASIVVAVSSDGLGAPAVFAATTGIGCGVAYWEAFG